MEERNTTGISSKELRSYGYPLNLILAISECQYNALPMSPSDDHYLGLYYALTTLTAREQEVLRLRYKEKWSLPKIAEEFYLSTSRAAQIEHRALRKMRNPARYAFIREGMMGLTKKWCEQEYKRGLTEGKSLGYKQCLEDIERGKTTEGFDVESLNMRFDELGLSVRSSNSMIAKGYETVGDIIPLRDDQITSIRNFGQKSIAEVAFALNRLGIVGTAWDKYC